MIFLTGYILIFTRVNLLKFSRVKTRFLRHFTGIFYFYTTNPLSCQKNNNNWWWFHTTSIVNFATCLYSFHRYFSVTISLVVTFFHMRFFQNFTQVSGNSKKYLVTLKSILFYPRKSTRCKNASYYLFFLPAAYMWQNAKIYLWHLVRSTS